MDSMIIKFKGARPHAIHFPDDEHMYTVAPLSFRNEYLRNGVYLPPIIGKDQFFGSAIEQMYREAASSLPFNTLERKWGKERIFCFGQDSDDRESLYELLRIEERMFSEQLVNVAWDVAAQINHPKMHAKITQGSHSPNYGMGAGNYMSWFDGDVNITYVLDVKPHNLLEESLALMPGHQPQSFGSSIFYHTNQDIRLPSRLPISQDITSWQTGYGLVFASAPDFYRNYGKKVTWRFMVENGYPVDNFLLGNFENMKETASNFETYRGFTKTDLSDNELEVLVQVLSQGADHFQFGYDGTPEFFSEYSKGFFDFAMDKFVNVLENVIPDFGWACEVTSMPHIEIKIKNKKIRIVGEKYS